MKGIIVVLLILLLLLAACVFFLDYIEKSAGALDEEMARLEQFIRAQEWEAARETLSEIEIHWENVSRGWKILINHEDIRDIEISMVDLKTALQQENKEEAEKEMSALRHFLKHVPENEKVALYNIL